MTVPVSAPASDELRIWQSAFLMVLFTLGAIAADHLAAPILFSSSPLWATAGCLLLIWRRSGSNLRFSSVEDVVGVSLSRVTLFVAAHLLLLISTRAFRPVLGPHAGALGPAGWLVTTLKLSVFLPTILLLPLNRWRLVARSYSAEIMAAFIVLLTFFPLRFLDALWPWYGQALGRLVYNSSKPFVPNLIYLKSATPTLSGPQLDVTIIQSCSGIDGIELFDYLFGFVAFLDWNRLRKGRTLLGYFGGLAAMLLGNAMRISSFVILGNHGFANTVARFHISAGWIFFSLVFLTYLSVTYHWLVRSPSPA